MDGYGIRYVDDELMGERDFLICNQHGDGVTIYLRRGIRRLPDEENAQILEAAWAAYRGMVEIDEIPSQWVYAGS